MLEKSETTQETATKNPEQTHPLMQWKPRIFSTLEEWRSAFDSAETASEKGGLLRQLTKNVPENNPSFSHEITHGDNVASLMIFLMDLADGYKDWKKFLNAGEYKNDEECERSAKNRQYVAQKAFDTLVQLYLNEKSSKMTSPEWREAFRDEAVFKKILWFIRLDVDSRHPMHRSNWLRNVAQNVFVTANKHSQELFNEFLLAFCTEPWYTKNHFDLSGMEEMQRSRQKFVDASPQFVEVLFCLERIDLLFGKTLNEASIAKLIDLVLHPLDLTPRDGKLFNDNVPKTLAEASMSKWSQVALAANLVLSHQARLAEQYRIENRATNNRTY